MTKPKSSISNATSYAEMGAFWDKTDLDSKWDSTSPGEFDIELEDEVMICRMPHAVSKQIRDAAKSEGVPPAELLLSWIREKLG